MESYAPLLEKTRIPQPSLQRLAVISIFQKIRSSPSSAAGIDALNLCLHSASPAVVDQSTRELCRLVKDSKFDLSTALLELHSALEGSSSPQSRCVFIKAIGFLARFGFQEKPSSFRFHLSEIHPFVKILSCGIEVQCELVKQVVLFILKCKHLGMEAVCEFLGPFLNYSVVKVPVMGHNLAFARNLISTMLAFCCSFPQEAIPVINLLTERLKYFSCKNAEEVANISYVVECLVDAYLVVLRQLVGMRFLVHEVQLRGLALVETILSLHTHFRKCSGGVEKIIDASRHLLAVQKELDLNYMSEFSSVMLSLFPILMQSELEHEQYPVLKLLLFLLRWKSEREYDMNAVTSELTEELLFIFPVLALVSSPSRCIKQIASDLLYILGKMVTALLIAPKKKQAGEWKQPSIKTPGHLMFRFLRNMWFEDKSLSLGVVYVNLFSNRNVYANEEHNRLKTWSSTVREYCLGIIEKHKQRATIAHSGESFLTELPLVLCAIASVLLLHERGNSVIDLLDIGSSLEPKLGVPLLLAVLFYSHIFSSKDKDNDAHDMLLKLLGLLPSLASHSAMTPLVVQILLPMLNNDVNPVIKATAIRMICKTWAINDRVFGTLHLGTGINISTVACALRCLSHAPRLPSLDWGAVIRRCMKYSDQVTELPTRNLALRRTLREECYVFSLSHANQSDSLLAFLDELSDLPRLKTLESNLQSLVFLHLGALLKIFSSSRLVKLFDDFAAFIPWFVSSDQYNQAQKVSLRVLCWKGLHLCLNESSLEVQDYAYTLEHCMEVLFEMLPWSHLTDTRLYHINSSAEWTEAIRCLGKARQSWLSNLLMVLDANFKEDNNRDLRTLKKIQAKAALVRIGSVPMLELAKLKVAILDTNSEVIWNILVEVTVTLQDTEENVRRQWLVDTAEILCVTSHPSTALRFLGLLCGSCCKYMPILIGDKVSVLTDLPVTLFALLSGTGWEMAAESVASYIWTSTERIHDWVTHIERADNLQIDRSENDSADVLLQVLHRTSVLLKDYLPVEKQLRLANMDFTRT